MGDCNGACALASGLCCLLTSLLLVWSVGLGGVVMLVLGSICVDQSNRGVTEEEWCPERGASIAMIVVGCLVVFCCCCGTGASLKNRQ